MVGWVLGGGVVEWVVMMGVGWWVVGIGQQKDPTLVTLLTGAMGH